MNREFKITSKTKRKARRRRQRGERKWKVIQILSPIILAFCACSFITGIFFTPNEEYSRLFFWILCFAISLMAFASVRALLTNLTSHWIQDRLNERIWVDDTCLYHFQQVAFAAGLNFRHADSTGYLFEIRLDSIKNMRYDPQSGRIEFSAQGIGRHFSDVAKQRIDKQWELRDRYSAIFYDYTEPSLIQYFEDIGIKYTECEIDYKTRDPHI